MISAPANSGRSMANVGHGNAKFLAALLEPGITKARLRERVKSGEFPNLWKGAGQWIEIAGVR